METRYTLYLLYSVIGIIGNVYGLYQEGSIFIVGISILSGATVIASAEKFYRTFDYPLFFVRDELNYWSGALGGVSSIVLYTIGYISFSLVEFTEILSIVYLIVSVFTVLLTLCGGTILRDIQLGYIEDQSS